MKKNLVNLFAFSFGLALLVPTCLFAQKEEKIKDKKDVQQIIITRKNDKGEKIIVEIKGDDILVNGKPMDEYKDKDGDVSVRLHKIKEIDALASIPGIGKTWDVGSEGNHLRFFSEESNKAMLGVVTEETEQGVAILDITKESAAEKAGLKEKDIITKIDDKKIENPDDLSVTIKNHKPGDKVTITYLRDKKEQKVTAELTKWKGMNAFEFKAPGNNYKMDMGDMNWSEIMPRIQAMPRMKMPNGQNFNWNWSGGSPKLGISVQDTDDGKGVKVIEVDEESNAEKAGIKEDDVITNVDGKEVNNADEIAKIIRESKDKVSVMIKLKRDGKTQNIEVKMPRKLKTADL